MSDPEALAIFCQAKVSELMTGRSSHEAIAQTNVVLLTNPIGIHFNRWRAAQMLLS